MRSQPSKLLTSSSSKKEQNKEVATKTAAKPITKQTEGAPVYRFQSEESSAPQREKFLPPEVDASIQAPLASVGEVIRLKMTLINSVATSLLCSPDFKSPSDPTRQNLAALADQLTSSDPEFLLKVALYTRNNLNIRTTANFLLALAANLQRCRPFLRKYFCASVRLPSDWIEVAELYQTFHDGSINFGALPTALRKVMAGKFVEFDVYQLAKYNKDKSKKKKKENTKKKDEEKKDEEKKDEEKKDEEKKDEEKKDEEKKDEEKKEGDSAAPPQRSDTSTTIESGLSVVAASDGETEEEVERLSFTLKQLIRKIHISEPVEPVMGLLGKKYPEDREAFRRSRLPGTWEEGRAGKRMKLATPETWETTVSLHGNKARTWEELIDHNKLPFMAMLRNLRNLIVAGVSQKHHRWVLGKLNDQRAVVNSRQFPFRFFSAYEVLSDLEKIADGEVPPKYRPKKGKKSAKPPPKVDKTLLVRYRSALDNSLKIATAHNVKPIPGSTLILCNVGSNMQRPCTAARGLGKPRTVREVGILLGLMCKYSCEQCTMVLCGESSYVPVELVEGTILHNMDRVQSAAQDKGLTVSEGTIPMKFLYEMLVNRAPVDNLVVLTDAMKLDDEQGREMMDFLEKYRRLVNPDLLFVSVDLSGRSSGVSSTIEPQHKNDVFLAGYSDQILRFIAERGDSGQLTYVDNIDRAYNLKEVPRSALVSQGATPANYTTSLAAEEALLASTHRQKWRTVRVFISSTFRDMHGERDLLTRFVFPELRARAHSRQIQLYEVDLRWGVTEEDTRHHRALEICLDEISRCDYFLGLLGERYGWVIDEEVLGRVSDVEWLKEEGVGCSITEIEMRYACLRDPGSANRRAFFYLRDPSVVSAIPSQHRAQFESESDQARENMARLKSEIRTSGLEVYDGYPSKWLGVLEDKAMVGRLEEFGQRVLHNIWNAVKRDFPDEETGVDPIAEATAAHDGFAENRANSFVGRRSLLGRALEVVEGGAGGVVLVEGKPGSGKSAFMAALAREATNSLSVITHFLGAAPSSTNIFTILARICHETKRRFNLERSVPDDYPELVQSWTEFLGDASAAGDGSKLAVFIDGLDLLEGAHNGRGMDWIPQSLPSGVVLVVSAVERGEISVTLKKRAPPPASVVVGRMNEWDKSEMVREKMARHSKSLDESPFNNQMKLLLSKKDAANPLFLHLACEELRVFGVFEEVSSFLRSLSPTLPLLLQELLSRMERELGEDLVSVALSLLSLVRNGLRECELSGLLSLFLSSKTEDSGKEEVAVPAMTLSRLLRCLQGFLQPTEQDSSDLLSLAHRDIESAVRLRYMKRGGGAEREKKLHQLLATYFKSECDPSGDRAYKGNDVRSFNELPHHLMCSGQWRELEETVCDVKFAVSKCQLGAAQGLLEDYTPSLEGLSGVRARDTARFLGQPRVETFRSFVSRNLHVLTATPSLALQQALNEPSSSAVATAAERALLDDPQPLVRWVNRSPGQDPCRLTLPVGSNEATCVAVSADGRQFAAGFKNCSVRVFNTATGAEVQSFVGHAAEITCVCFVGSHALCSASHDSNLSLWDMKGGFRIATMTSHTRSVRGCAADAVGKVLVSVSWDADVRVWNGRTGKQTCCLATRGGRNSPLNCVSFNPTSDQLVAVGSWDTTVKIWDVFSQKRVKVLKGHHTSVQACVYAPSGRHIVSAAMDGEVKVWSTKSGSAVGSITGHSGPVNSLSYTPNGQFLLTASSDRLVKVWSGTLGQQVGRVGKSEFGYARCVVHSRPNQTVLVGYHDGHVRQFNTQTGSEQFAVKLHEKAVVALGVQGQFIMSASADVSIKIWQGGPSSLPVHLQLEGHKAAITCAVWSRHGLASAAEDFSLLLWPHEQSHYTGLWKLAKRMDKYSKGTASVYPLLSLKGHTGTISSLSFSGDGLKLASASHDRSVIVWDLLTKKESHTLRECHKDWITACAFPDSGSDALITGSNDFNLKLWNLKTGEERITFRGHTSAINSLSYCSGCVVSAAYDGSVKVWTHKGIEITTLYAHQQRVNCCQLDMPGGAGNTTTNWADMMEEGEEEGEGKGEKKELSEVLVVTASDDGTVGVWRPFVPNEVTGLVGHSDRVVSVATTLNNEIITSSRDKTIRIWSPELPGKVGGVSVNSSTQAHVGEVSAAAVCRPYIATGGRDGRVIVWTTTEGCHDDNDKQYNLEKLYHIKSCDTAISSLVFTSSTDTGVMELAVGRDDGAISRYRFSDTTFPFEHSMVGPGVLMGAHPVSGLGVAYGGKVLLASSWSRSVVAVSREGRVKLQVGHDGWVTGVTVGRKGRETFAVTVGLDRVLQQWSLGHLQGKKTPTTQPTPTVHRIPDDKDGDNEGAWLLCLCLLDSTHVAIGDSGGRVWLWNLETKRVAISKKVHRCAINGVAVVRTMLVTGSKDKTIKIWRVNQQRDNLVQVGHFHAQAPVTSLTAHTMETREGEGEGEGPTVLLTAGDSLGHVMLLQWHN